MVLHGFEGHESTTSREPQDRFPCWPASSTVIRGVRESTLAISAIDEPRMNDRRSERARLDDRISKHVRSE